MQLLFLILGIALGAALVLALHAPRLRGAAARAASAERLLEAERAAHECRLEDLRQATDEKVALLAGNRQQLAEQMKAISADAFREQAAQAQALAEAQRQADREAAVGELGRRAAEFQKAILPLAESVRRLETGVSELERDRRQTHGHVAQMFTTVTQEVNRLRDQTGTLVSALKRPQVRGSWGEMQLRNCVEAANMTDHVDFVAQRTLDGGDAGRLRPDMIVHLPADRRVVVDSKVPMDAYLQALEAPDEARQAELLDQHARQVRQHIDALASKRYHAQLAGRSPEFVVCFIPNEAIYCAALERDPSLLEYGAGKGVLISTPTSLIALLQAVYYGWRQERIAESAREIAEAGRELHKRVATFLEPFGKLGRQLNSAVTAYNQATGSLEARVLPQLRRIEQAGAASEKSLSPLAQLDTPASRLVAPELELDLELGPVDDDGPPPIAEAA